MKDSVFKIVHYVNQFYGQIGGEEKADVGFSIFEGPVGPGVALEKNFNGDAKVIATVVCGDNYFSSDPEKNSKQFIEMIRDYHPDIVVAGPAFEAGRYGISCGAVCAAVTESLKIPALTGMFVENPGIRLYREKAFIVKTGQSARHMAEDMKRIARLGISLLKKEWAYRFLTGDGVGSPEEYEYYTRGIVKNEITTKTAAQRALDMLLAKVKNKPFETELALPDFDTVPSPKPVQDLGECTIALVSDGGLCKKGNEAGMSGRGNSVWTTYSIKEFFSPEKTKDDYEIVHTGYFPVDVLEDVNRLVPVDVMREFEKEGKIGKLFSEYFCTSGNATVADICQRIGAEMAKKIIEEKVDAVLLTST